MISDLTDAVPRPPLSALGTTEDDTALATRRGMRGLLTAIGLGLLLWLITGVIVAFALVR